MPGIRTRWTVRIEQRTCRQIGNFGAIIYTPWTTLEVVDPDGAARQCCADWTAGDRGNLHESSLADVWNGDGYRFEAGHASLQEWLRDNGKEQRAPLWEVYWTDPGQEPDPTRWKTEIIMPIR